MYCKNEVKVSRANKFIKKIIAKTFPEYNGRRIFVCDTDGQAIDLNQSLGEIQVTDRKVVNLATGEIAQVRHHNVFAGESRYSIEMGCAVVEWSSWASTLYAIRIYVDMTKYAPGQIAGGIAGLLA